MPAKIILIRHGETDWNMKKRYQGHADTELNENGLRQARALSERMKGEGVSKVFSSDSMRAYRFAGIIFPDINITKRPDLRELDFGPLEGLTYEEAIERYGQAYRSWISDPHSGSLAGCESMAALKDRVWRAIGDIASTESGRTCAVVTHAGPIRVIISGIDRSMDFWEIKPESGGITVIEGSGSDFEIKSKGKR